MINDQFHVIGVKVILSEIMIQDLDSFSHWNQHFLSKDHESNV